MKVRTYIDVHTHVEILEIHTYIVVYFIVGLRIRTIRSLLLDNFIFHILELNMCKDKYVFIFHLIPSSLVHATSFYILTLMQFGYYITLVLYSLIHALLFRLISLGKSYSNIYVLLAHLE